MLLFFKTAAAVACMFLIIPLAVWAGSGSLRSAWGATKDFLLIMGVLVALGAGAGLLAIFTTL